LLCLRLFFLEVIFPAGRFYLSMSKTGFHIGLDVGSVSANTLSLTTRRMSLKSITPV